jgi:hypothetical protein
MGEEAAEPQMETGADFTSATVATMSMTFDERLLQDNERRAQARQLNSERAKVSRDDPTGFSFRPEIGRKTNKLAAGRLAREAEQDSSTANGVFTRLEREAHALADRHKQAKERRLKEESGLFKPQVNSARSAGAGEEVDLKPWEGSTAALAWKDKRMAMIEQGIKLRAEQRSGPRPGGQQSSTMETPRRERAIVHDLPLPFLPSMKHSGKPLIMTRELHRQEQRYRGALLEVGPAMRMESPRKFPHLKPNSLFLGYSLPAASEMEYVTKKNRILLERLKKINQRDPEYATVEHIRPGGSPPRKSAKEKK